MVKKPNRSLHGSSFLKTEFAASRVECLRNPSVCLPGYDVIIVIVFMSLFNYSTVKHIEEQNRLHDQACKLVKFLCMEIAYSNCLNAIEIFRLTLFKATSRGIVEIVEEILSLDPDVIFLKNKKEQYIFHRAIECRQEKVFNLIHQNNAPHLAGKLAPEQQLYLKAGAALQMQRELQWYKVVEGLTLPRSKVEWNDKGMTPASLFTATHKNLVKEGERWMKDTANACTIVAVLIATMVFAAAITVPGGNNSNGNPIFYKQACFIILCISFFLIHYFCVVVRVHPHFSRLIFGLATLFLCILSTMIAFGATLYLVFVERYKTWIIIPILAFAFIPVVLFVHLKFQLVADMIKSTKGTIFVMRNEELELELELGKDCELAIGDNLYGDPRVATSSTCGLSDLH
ncbi:hypothetical protein HYC85_000484 [Camellia sinensis]|uniref:PGG domain-containing protein n=1 Tax=Camellia sinensis TaxID=4442 RepID=A0A7J7I3G2_CAMSI|nr:hypothetical protein HYC85_000484 [Camellia sinensis]